MNYRIEYYTNGRLTARRGRWVNYGLALRFTRRLGYDESGRKQGNRIARVVGFNGIPF